MQPYTEDHYASHKERPWSSAREIVPLALEMLQPNTVIDLGRGTGEWLSVSVQGTWCR